MSVLIYLINTFLKLLEVTTNKFYSNQFTLGKEIPQGSSISTSLFLVTNNNIIKQIPKPEKIILYADYSYA